MKIALLGDIHGNAYALNAVLNAAKEKQVETLLITGDLVGYYFSPGSVMELLEPWSKYIVRGNHEEMLAQARKDTGHAKTILRKYGSGIDIAINQLSQKQLDRLCSLPHPLSLSIKGREILLCHGAPHSLDTYIYPENDLEILKSQNLDRYDLIVIGHTHYPMHKELSAKTQIINPGSVGQPRNRSPGAYWAFYDTDIGIVNLHREEYDYSVLQAEAQQRHPELPYLTSVLGRT